MKMMVVFLLAVSLVFGGVIDPAKPYYVQPIKEEKKAEVLKRPVTKVEKGEEQVIELKGSLSLYRALSIIASATGVDVVIEKDVEDVQVSLSVKGTLGEVIDALCTAADVWCDYFPREKKIEVRKYKDMVIDIDPEGRVVFSYGGFGFGTGGQTFQAPLTPDQTQTQTAGTLTAGGGFVSAIPVSYTTLNISADEFLEILSRYMNVKYYPSPSGYVIAKLTPSQWRDVQRFFEEKKRREEVVEVEVKLLRVDLRDEFRFGIDWRAVFKGFRIGEVNRIGVGVSFNPLVTIDQDITLNSQQGFLAVIDRDDQIGGFISALEEFGKVHTVDTWVYRMKTGTPIPFANARTITYFTIGAVQGLQTTSVFATPVQDIVGFSGVLAVYKREKGYYVEGYVDISDLLGFVVQETPQGELRAPEKAMKTFRISTYLSDLGKVLVVGGFKVSGISAKDRGVPFLQRIPVLGWLFKYKEDLSQNSEFVVLIALRHAEEFSPEEVHARVPLMREPSDLIEEYEEEVLEEDEDLF